MYSSVVPGKRADAWAKLCGQFVDKIFSIYEISPGQLCHICTPLKTEKSWKRSLPMVQFTTLRTVRSVKV